MSHLTSYCAIAVILVTAWRLDHAIQRLRDVAKERSAEIAEAEVRGFKAAYIPAPVTQIRRRV